MNFFRKLVAVLLGLSILFYIRLQLQGSTNVPRLPPQPAALVTLGVLELRALEAG